MKKVNLFLFFSLLAIIGFSNEWDEFYKKAEQSYNAGRNVESAALFNKAAYGAWDAGNFDFAIKCFRQSLQINKGINENAVKVVFSDLGDLYVDRHELDNAFKVFDEALELCKKNNDKAGIGKFVKKEAEVLHEQGKYDLAIEKLNEAIEIGYSISDQNLLRNCYRNLSECYKSKGDFTKQAEFFELYRGLLLDMQQKQQDVAVGKAKTEANQLRNEKSVIESEYKKITEERNSIQKERDLAHDNLEQLELIKILKDDQLAHIKHEKELEILAKDRANMLLVISGVGFVLVFLSLGWIYRSFLKMRKLNVQMKIQKEAIEKQNLEIAQKGTDLSNAYDEIHEKSIKIESSINYAKRIQKSLLPAPDKLKDFFEDSFLIFKPKDIVSGDFYWFSHVKKGLGEVRKDKNRYAIAAVDCTGHGVPGAFMSMLGFNALRNIANSGINRTDLILNELHRLIRFDILKQHKNTNRDGMDMALCIVDKDKKVIQFSGAKNPLVYIQDGELFHIKGDKYPIGGVQKEDERIFTYTEIDISKPTYCYLFSDGFPDQFGGPEGRKFMIKKLKELFLEHHLKPMAEQNDIFEKELKDWLISEGKEVKQIDDILLIGFKVG